MDAVTQNLVTGLLEEFEIKSSDDSWNFEFFTAFCALTNEYPDTADFNTMAAFLNREQNKSGGGDTGLDAIGIIINGRYVETPDDIDSFMDMTIDSKIILVSSKTSSSFDVGEISSFAFGIKDLFSELLNTSPQLPRNKAIVDKAKLIQHLYTRAASFKKNPACKVYYVTTGNYNPEDKNLSSRFLSIKSDLEATNLFSDVEVYPFGAHNIQKIYQQSRRKSTAEIIFERKTTLPEIKGIQEAYMGILPFLEFKKLIIDDKNEIKGVFDENVRAFQGLENKVNEAIEKTIKSGPAQIFSILNNGVTVVAKNIKITGNRLLLEDYQIINGCQTSNVLYECRDESSINDLLIPIRIYSTTDEALTKQITVATNTQTPVKIEEMASLSEFHRGLEQFYSSGGQDFRLFYERRSKQYDSDKKVQKNRIVTISQQVRSFAALFLEEPHRVSRNYGDLMKESLGKRIFVTGHKWLPYYVSALFLYRLERLFSQGVIDAAYKKCRYHMILAAKYLISDEAMPHLTSNKIDAYCVTLLEGIKDEKCEAVFEKARDLIKGLDVDPSDYDRFRTADVTKRLMESAKTAASC